MDVYGGWVFIIYAGLAHDGALDCGGDWVVGDSSNAQDVALGFMNLGGRIR
jgi:hypothetical protein